MYTAPVLYEKYEDHVDTAAAKAMVEIKKQYAILDTKVLQKIPGAPLSIKKQNWIILFYNVWTTIYLWNKSLDCNNRLLFGQAIFT